MPIGIRPEHLPGAWCTRAIERLLEIEDFASIPL